MTAGEVDILIVITAGTKTIFGEDIETDEVDISLAFEVVTIKSISYNRS